MRAQKKKDLRVDQNLDDLLENPAETTRTSVSVLSSAALSLPRVDPRFVILFQNFEPWEALSGGAERGIATGASFERVGDSETESEVVLVRATRAGIGAVLGVGGLYPWTGFGPSSGETHTTRFAASVFFRDDNPARTGVVGPGVGGPEDDSSLSSCACPLPVPLSSSSSNTGSDLCITSSGSVGELWVTLEGRFADNGGVYEKSHESIVSWKVDDARLRRSWRCVSGGRDSDKIVFNDRSATAIFESTKFFFTQHGPNQIRFLLGGPEERR